MSELQHFEVVGDHAEFRPSGQVSLDQMAQLVASAIALAREQHVRKLLAVTCGLTGFKSPDTFDRYYFIHKWAEASDHGVRVALVALPEMIDPQKFGVLVASNIGFIADIFASEAEALAWLQSAE
ncbi:MAG: hypothetical protein NT105_15010 [Verrucomicrobia bacterium]|nr:hypothetical protein [Verrucomicrobiota bacterium]